jgi:hypothetical protein
MARTSKKERVPLQPDGMPQGRHMAGFKGSKVEGLCLCGSCHPNAQAGKNKTIYIGRRK